ncbi:MAG: hypothetical protein CMF38_05890 [Legionellaceae bacterium]|nr:hypothetical protein [Legionellaceae bacterium]HAF87374.1 hypothetical protein [Legionellales bacterium]HCA89324.1 hypothetical protein [Legionellales bacterium]|tara:strand:+ start:721 stop:906 length:186 start_codon:yes stop_codon:yes gene_type:complete
MASTLSMLKGLQSPIQPNTASPIATSAPCSSKSVEQKSNLADILAQCLPPRKDAYSHTPGN